jgi:DNA-binding IclR family transcriptional regulator
MQVGRSRYSIALEVLFSEKEVTLLAEIGLDEIATATSFVEYFCSKYGISRSGTWYCLKKLKKEGVVEFTEKGEEYRPLRMTEKGLGVFRSQVYRDKLSGTMPAIRVF